MNRNKIIIFAVVVLGVFLACNKQPSVVDTDEHGMEDLKNDIRPEPIPINGKLEFDKSRLPKDARGKFASYDGDNFTVNFPPNKAASLSAQQVLDQTVRPLLSGMGYGERSDIVLADARPEGDKLPTPNLTALSNETCQEVESEKYQRFHPVCEAIKQGKTNEITDRVFDLAYGMTFAQFKADIERQRIQYVFQQRVEKVIIEHKGIIAARWEGETITTVHGSILNRYRITNNPDLTAQQAVEMGQAQVLKFKGINPRFDEPKRDPAELVLLPYGSANDDNGNQVAGLRYAYRTLLFAYPARGQAAPGNLLSWLAWIDAKDGKLLSLTAQFDNISARGSAWRRDPNTPAQPHFFQVDASSGGQYVLSRSGVFNRFDRLGDGAFDDEEVSISDSGSGSSATFANFDQSPINDAANAVCSGLTNNTFRQVNAYAHLHRYRETLMNAGTFPVFPELSTTVRVDTPDPLGNNALYDAFGPGQSRLIFVPGTTFTSANCPDVAGGVLPGTTDPTSMAHEYAHISTKRLQARRPADWCGTPSCFMPDAGGSSMFHDFADGWAEAYASTPCQAGWSRKNTGGIDNSENCANHNEGGGLPRLSSIGEPFSTASLLDHFPERRATLTGGYQDMQIVATALWLTRQGMRSKCLPSGTPQYWVRLNRGLYNYGFLTNTCGGTCDRDIYIYSQNLLDHLAWQWANAGLAGGPPGFAHNGNHTTNKLLSGWARVGIFLTPFTCIDGDAATGHPTFCPVADGGEMGGDAIVDVFDNDAADDNVIDGITHPEFDYAQRGDPPANFRVWTGPRYKFNAAGVANSYTPSAATPSPCHTQFQVEISSTDTFASFVSSGWQPASATAEPECYGTWTPDPADWATLGGTTGDVKVYYRVRTRDAGGLNERISTRPGNGSYMVPPAYVVVNDAGQP